MATMDYKEKQFDLATATPEQKVTMLEAEVNRYKTTLTKMEKQWREAIAAVDSNTLQRRIQAQNQTITDLNNSIIDLKTENQVLKLKLHQVQTEVINLQGNQSKHKAPDEQELESEKKKMQENQGLEK